MDLCYLKLGCLEKREGMEGAVLPVHQDQTASMLPCTGQNALRAVRVSDGQGFGKPLGYKGKGKEGKGQGTDFETLVKPLPF